VIFAPERGWFMTSVLVGVGRAETPPFAMVWKGRCWSHACSVFSGWPENIELCCRTLGLWSYVCVAGASWHMFWGGCVLWDRVACWHVSHAQCAAGLRKSAGCHVCELHTKIWISGLLWPLF